MIESDSFVFGFVGRHNQVKGYDLFREAGQRLIKGRNDLLMLSAGGTPEEVAQSTEQWRELGWCRDLSTILTAVDYLVIPNRSTYFDLILIESLSTGTPVLTTFTGGNATFSDVASKVIQFCEPNADSLYEAMRGIISCGRDDLRRLGGMAQHYYESHLTSAHFAQRYYDAVRKMDTDAYGSGSASGLLGTVRSVLRTMAVRS